VAGAGVGTAVALIVGLAAGMVGLGFGRGSWRLGAMEWASLGSLSPTSSRSWACVSAGRPLGMPLSPLWRREFRRG
jgi:hypothetical protein